jgi:hypothetical protein
MEIAYNQDSFIQKLTKWTVLGICIYLSVIGLSTFHSYQVQKIASNNMVTMQKSSLISQMHNEMLLITRTQLQILHASNESEVRKLLWILSELVSDYLIHYQQLEGIADGSDTDLLAQFRTGFDQWHSFNKNLLAYANVVADSDFINTLNIIDMAFSQLDRDSNETLLLIAQLKDHSTNTNSLSN